MSSSIPDIEKMEKKKDVKGLIRAFKYKKYMDLRKYIIEALSKIGEPAVELLIQALKDKDSGPPAAQALGNIGDIRAVEPLIQALQDKHWGTRSLAAQALGNIGDTRAVEPLIRTLKDKKEKNPVILTGAAIALGKMGEPAVEPLIHTLKNKHCVVFAAQALGNIRDAKAVESLIQALKKFRQAHIQVAVATALQTIGEPAVESLIQALQDKHWEIRFSAARALGNIGDTRAVESLIHTLKDKHKMSRMEAAIALGNIGDTRAVEPLTHTLKDKDWNVRSFAKKALEKIKAKESEEKP